MEGESGQGPERRVIVQPIIESWRKPGTRKPRLLHSVRGPVAASESEPDLLRRLRSGDHEAFERLVRRHGGSLLAAARRLLRREEDARDAVQETFLSAFRSLSRFRGSSSLSTWLHRILFNTALMKIRSASRHPEAPMDERLPGAGAPGTSGSPASSWPDSAEAVLLRSELRSRVRAAVESLPLSYRSVLTLRDLEELDTPTVARLLSATPTAVRLRLFRARQALRERLESFSATA